MVVVLGNDHTNSLGVVQSLDLVGFHSIALLYGQRTGLVESSKFVKRIISAPSAQDCINKLLMLSIDGDNIIPIIPCSDMAALILEKNTEQLKPRFVFECANNFSLEFLAKKENQVKLAREAGFYVPKTWNLNNSKDILTGLCYPCFIKPLVSCEGAKSDIRIAKN